MGSSVLLPAPGQPREGPDPNFISGAIPSAVTINFAGMDPPVGLYVQPDDTIEMAAVSNQANDAVGFRVRFLHVSLPTPGQPDASPPQEVPLKHPIAPYIGIYDFSVALPTPRTFVTIQRQLGEGFILSVFAFSSVATTRGQAFARAAVLRGIAPTTTHNLQLVSDYTDNHTAIGWPFWPQRHFLEGPGWLHSLQQANPAAGADWTLTVAAGQRLRIESFCATFTASAAAANRQVEVIIDDGANVYWRTSSAVNITAGQVVAFCGTTTNAPAGLITTDNSVVIPPTIALPSGHRIRTATTAIQAGDQWSAIWFGVEEWLDF